MLLTVHRELTIVWNHGQCPSNVFPETAGFDLPVNRVDRYAFDTINPPAVRYSIENNINPVVIVPAMQGDCRGSEQ